MEILHRTKVKNAIFVIFLLALFFSPLFAKAETYYTLKGKKVSYASLISAPNTILYVWSKWCPVCRKQLKAMGWETYLPQDVQMYYVAVGEKRSNMRKLISILDLHQSITENIIFDEESVLVRKFSIVGVPTFIFFRNKVPVYQSHYINKDLIEKIFGDE